MVIIVWGSSIWSQIRVRRAIKKQGKDANELLPYKAPFYPLGPIVVIATLLFVLFGSSFGSIASGGWIGVIICFTPVCHVTNYHRRLRYMEGRTMST